MHTRISVKQHPVEIPTTTGYAVMTNGFIDVRTIQGSPVGAMVNWLFCNADILPLRRMPDDEIRELYEKAVAESDLEVVLTKVIITQDTAGVAS